MKLNQGKSLFKKCKKKEGYQDIDIFAMWACLPLESRMLWAGIQNQQLLLVLKPQKHNQITSTIRYGQCLTNPEGKGEDNKSLQQKP